MQLRDQKARIDSCEHICLMDPLPLGENDLHDLPADAGFDRDRVVCLDQADALQLNGHIPAIAGGNDYGSGRSGRTVEMLGLCPL
jgi:hypothetical protein